MPSPRFSLEEQLSDLRSDQIAYKLTIENIDSKPIRLISVRPRVPIGASLLKITDSSLAESMERKNVLIDDLNKLLQLFLLATTEGFRQQVVVHQQEVLKKVFSVAGIFRFYFQLLTNISAVQAQLKREFESIRFTIASAADSRSASARWLEKSSENDTIRTLFEAKTDQLEQIEALMGENDRSSLTNIEPGSCFTATYVLKFARQMLEPRKYQIGFDATYIRPDEPIPQSNSTATNVQISPYPFTLSVVAMVAAVLGVLLRVSLTADSNLFDEMYNLAASGRLIVGPVLAFIFFNVYEHTSVGKEMRISVSWRSALLIGALCGLAQDRVLDALKALIGV